MSVWARVFVGAAVLAATIVVVLFSASVYGFEEDARGVVVRVIDGDTFDAVVTNISASAPRCLSVVPGERVRVRLADIDAPERGEPGYSEATLALEALVDGRVVVLDVDDYRCRGPYGRVIAVVYVEYNETHLLNVNAYLLRRGFVRPADYPNEFTPWSWSLYVEKPGAGRKGLEANTSTATSTSAASQPAASATATGVGEGAGSPSWSAQTVEAVTVVAEKPVTVTVVEPVTFTTTSTVIATVTSTLERLVPVRETTTVVRVVTVAETVTTTPQLPGSVVFSLAVLGFAAGVAVCRLFRG